MIQLQSLVTLGLVACATAQYHHGGGLALAVGGHGGYGGHHGGHHVVDYYVGTIYKMLMISGILGFLFFMQRFLARNPFIIAFLVPPCLRV